MNKFLPIKEIFDFEKGSLQSSKAIDGEYDFITASAEWKKHASYEHDKEALIIAVAASGSLGRAHYINGKFISSDLCFILTPKDPKKLPVDLRFYHRLFQAVRDDLVQKTATGTSKLAINQTSFGNYKIPYFDINYQKEHSEKFYKFERQQNLLQQQIENQKTYLKNLRKQILQDAIEGKLTKEWRKQNPNAEPASELLKKIKQEKEKLISEKKIKKEKPLPPINKNEIPLELPNSWTWTRLGELSAKIGSGSTPKGSDYSEKGIPFFRSQNVHNDGLVYDDIKFISDSTHKKMCSTSVIQGDILLNITGGSIGRCSLVPTNFKEGNVSQHVCIIRPILIKSSLLHAITLSPLFQKYITSSTTGAGREGLPKYNLEQFIIPIIPLKEQTAIIEKIKTLMQKLDEVEKQIEKSLENSRLLTKAILSEAFSGNAEKELPTIEKLIEKAEKSYEEEGFVNIKKIASSYGVAIVRDSSVNKAQIRYENDNYAIHIKDQNDNFSIAHEIAHYVTHRDHIKKYAVGRKDEYSLSDSEEKKMDNFAAKILMPESCVRGFIKDEGIAESGFVNDKLIRTLFKQFKISEPTMRRRLKELGYKANFKATK